MPRPRRHDPDRKARIAAAAVGVIAEHGVAGTTHRRVAAAADVPLGSMTYHFDGLRGLLREAFAHQEQVGSAQYAAHFDGVTDRASLVEAVVDVVHAAEGDPRGWVLNYELYLAAQRDPALREVTEDWMRASRRVLERFVAAEDARGLDALIEGLQIHKGLSTVPVTREQTRHVVATHLSTVEVHAG